jgi:hypothetical protein
VKQVINSITPGNFLDPGVPSFIAAGEGKVVAFKNDLLPNGNWDFQIWGKKDDGKWYYKSLGNLDVPGEP